MFKIPLKRKRDNVLSQKKLILQSTAISALKDKSEWNLIWSTQGNEKLASDVTFVILLDGSSSGYSTAGLLPELE